MRGRYEKRKEKKPQTPGSTAFRVVMIVIGVILVLPIALVIAGVVYYNSILGKMNQVVVPTIDYSQLDAASETGEATTEATEAATETTEAPTTEATEPPHVASSADYLNILVVGQSAREGEAEENYRFADTAILCTINTYEKTLTLTSLLRDTLVRPPDYKTHTFGKIKLTTVYHLGSTYGDDIAGSMELMNMTLYSNFGIEVDYNFEINFDAFIKVIDALDGVEIELTQEEADYLNDDDTWVYYDFEPGVQRLDGMCALSYARMRKAEGDADSDIKRTARQRKLMEALVEKLKTINPTKLQRIANEVLPLISTSMTDSQITDTLLTLLTILPDLKIQTGGTCPVEGLYWGDEVDIYNNGQYHSVLYYDEGQVRKAMRALTEGETDASTTATGASAATAATTDAAN